MSGADADRTDARLSSLEATVDQMDKRMARVEEQIDRLDTRIDERFTSLRRDMRRWLYLLFFAISVVVTIITAVTQLLLVG